MLNLHVSIKDQTLKVLDGEKIIKCYNVSTAKNGPGEDFGSEKTPRGLHQVRAKIGADCEEGAVFRARRPTGEVFTAELKASQPERDWILTRIFWLSGLEVGKNRLGSKDTMRRYVYIHGTPPDVDMGYPGSKGCIRMNNKEIIELFNLIPVQTKVLIVE